MKADYRTEEDAPQNVPPSTNGEKQHGQNGDRYPVPPADPFMESVFAKFWNIGQKLSRIVLHGFAGENPAHVGPKPSIVGRMRVTLLIGVLVMQAVGRNPEERSAFQGQRTAHSQNIFHPFGSLVSAMREQP